MPTTPRGLRYPADSDRVMDGAAAIKNLANDVDGQLDALPVSAANSVFVGAPAASVHVNFPAGRFGSPPMVTAVPTTGGNVAIAVNVANVTSAGCDFYFYGIGGAWTAGAVSVFWHAIEGH